MMQIRFGTYVRPNHRLKLAEGAAANANAHAQECVVYSLRTRAVQTKNIAVGSLATVRYAVLNLISLLTFKSAFQSDWRDTGD